MTLPAGTRLGSCEIVSLLGTGGMGEVYRARDATLQRDVAVKVLPAVFATDPDRLARFRREAQILAALNHPHIAQIYGVHEDGAALALVLELVDGTSLADRIAQGPIAIAEALRIATEIASALEAAHGQSIIHRDLKPANVKVRADGSVKVLDFGLAKAFEPSSTSADEVANSPTITNRATALGMILGTAAYMAPEQAKGKAVDKRADIWAFGVVTYEMLAGRRLFQGEDVSDTLAEVLKTDPDWSALPRTTPAPIRRMLRRCLERDPKRRLHDIADARLEIEEALAAPPDSIGPSDRGRSRERWLWVMAATAAAVVAAAAALSFRPVRMDAPETRLQIITPPSPFPFFAMSPDGREVAYWGRTDGRNRLWRRPLAVEDAQELPGTEGPGSPLVWLPDGRSILFVDRQTLKEVTVDGGAAHALPAQVAGLGMSGNADGVILFAPANAAPISRVHAAGGTPEPATRVTPPQVGHRFPHFLPDGRHFLFLVSGPHAVQGIYLGALDTLEARRLVAADTAAVFAPPDFVVFGRQDTLFAQRLNLRTLTVEGDPILVALRPLQWRSVFGSVALAASATGALAYRQAVVPRRQLAWVDRSGRELGLVGAPDAAESESSPQLSPDGRTILLVRRQSGNTDLWTITNAPQGALQRLTADPAVEGAPIWSPDGSQIAFQSSRKGGGFYDLYRKSVGGVGEEVVLLESPGNKTMNDWSRDSRFVLYALQDQQQVARDLWALPLQSDGQPFPVTRSPFDEISGRFSPDSRWIAYQSNAAGTGYDVYVRAFPGPGREWRISPNGGLTPRWRGDGRELYYLTPGNQLMAVRLSLPATGDAVDHGPPVPLFTLRGAPVYAPSPDGQRFLVNQILDDVPTPPITVILNWQKP
jgi:Tol biopolymer transport system component